jgi:hypothetical protein
MAENLSDIFASTEPTQLATGWGRAEGPLWHAEGYVTFVDLEPRSVRGGRVIVAPPSAPAR